jgi:seryl-tRNA synthetase
MLDLAFIRNHPDLVKEAARLKNNPIDIDALLELDQRVLALQHHVEETRAKQNQLSKSIQQAAKEKNVVLRNELIAQGKQLAEQIKQLEPELAQAIEQRSNMLLIRRVRSARMKMTMCQSNIGESQLVRTVS